jgi:hypothetical protein
MSTTLQSAGKIDHRQKFLWRMLGFWARAYGGSLVITSVAFPIIASGATICFYLAPQIALPFLPIRSQWYAPVYGFLTTCIVCLLIAALRSRFSTANGANIYIYEELKNRHSELEARLSVVNIHDKKSAATSPQNDESDDNARYRIEASRRACKTYENLHQSLFHNHSGLEWTLGTGYVNAWHMVHRTQEALVGVETLQEVIGDVVHDIRSIQNSAMPDSKVLIRKMLQAVKDLCPEAMVYFDELRADKYYTDLFPPQTGIDLADSTKLEQPGQTDQLKEIARETIRQVKHALNVYQDSLRHKLVQGRNYTYIAIALAGFITYLLLCFVILWNTTSVAIGTATAYYMIGAITGLFVRFYNETNGKNDTAPPDDYGLLLSRLIAIPLLSGLAALGGVLVTATLPALSGQSGQKVTELGTIFNGTVTIEYLLAAAIFGYAPNLIVGNLQQRTQRYSIALQNSKGEVSSKDD